MTTDAKNLRGLLRNAAKERRYFDGLRLCNSKREELLEHNPAFNSPKRGGNTPLLVHHGGAKFSPNTGETLLLSAAGSGHDDEIIRLLDHNPSVNVQDERGNTPLQLYCRKGECSLDVLKRFLHHGVNPRILNTRKQNCLHIAALEGNVEVVRFLLDPEKYGWAEKLVEDIDARDAQGSTALHWAVSSGSNDVIDEILDHNLSVNGQDEEGNTPLQQYCGERECSVHIVKKFLHHGADPRILNREKQNCLHVAALEGNVEVVRFFLDPEKYGWAEKLVDDIDARDAQGRTALHLAVTNGRNDVIDELLDHNPSVNVKDERGNTPLQQYCKKGECSLDKLMRFLHDGADPRILNSRKQNCLHIAALAGNVEVVRFLWDPEKYGWAEKLVEDIDARDAQGSTALHLAVSSGSNDVIDEILDYNPSVNGQDEEGNTLLQQYCKKTECSVHIVKKFLHHGADPRILNTRKQNCLHVATVRVTWKW